MPQHDEEGIQGHHRMILCYFLMSSTTEVLKSVKNSLLKVPLSQTLPRKLPNNPILFLLLLGKNKYTSLIRSYFLVILRMFVKCTSKKMVSSLDLRYFH